MKSSKLLIVRGPDSQVRATDGPPTLCPLHKHAAKVIRVMKDSKEGHTITREPLAQTRKTGWFPATSGDMLRCLDDVMPLIGGPPLGCQPSRRAIRQRRFSSRQSDLQSTCLFLQVFGPDVSATHQDDSHPRRAEVQFVSARAEIWCDGR